MKCSRGGSHPRLSGLLPVKLALETGGMLTHLLSAAFFGVSYIFVYRSFYGMRIRQSQH